MVAGIAHEINNPAQAISFSMDGLKVNFEYVKELIKGLQRYLETETAVPAEEKERIQRMMNEVDINLVLESIDDIASRNIRSVQRIDHIVKSTKRMAHIDNVYSPCELNTIIIDAVVLTHNQVKPFFTTKKIGTGLGLHLCHQIIDSHGGEIIAASEPGSGTCFTVRIFV